MKVTFAQWLAISVVLLAVAISNVQSWSTAKDVSRQADAQSAALVSSARQVVKDGCERDNTNQTHFRNLLKRLRQSSEQSHKAGRTTDEQYREAKAFYDEQLRVFSLADCQAAVSQITDRP